MERRGGGQREGEREKTDREKRGVELEWDGLRGRGEGGWRGGGGRGRGRERGLTEKREG